MTHYVYRTTCRVNDKTYVGVRSCEGSPLLDTYLGSGTALLKAAGVDRGALGEGVMTPERKARLRALNLGNQRRLGTRGSERQRRAVAESNRRRAR